MSTLQPADKNVNIVLAVFGVHLAVFFCRFYIARESQGRILFN